MTDSPRCHVEIAEPNRSMLGSYAVQKSKRDYLNWLTTGLTPNEAAAQVGRDTRTVESWRRHDASFDSACERAIVDLRITYLPTIESNIFKQAMQPTPAGARLGLKVLATLDPESWGKGRRPASKR